MKYMTVELPPGLTKKALEDLAITKMPDLRKYEGPSCSECAYWKDDRCVLYSGECATAVFDRKIRPPSFTQKEKPK